MTHPPGEDAGLEFDLGPLPKKALAHHVYAAIERDSLGQARLHALLRGKPRTPGSSPSGAVSVAGA
jgi:hypothetical protein